MADNPLVKAQQVADNINKSGGKALAVAGDMLDAEYIKVLVKKAAEFGNGKIHIIVNNAGLATRTPLQPAIIDTSIVTLGTV
jgi:3-oxoacyl-[acyl-carrier protein] reductase